MIPKYRAWIKTENCFADYIESIRFYINEIDLCWDGICESDCFDFRDVELMQSTGLKDKNGKEIFEGDILGTKDGLLNGVVEYRSDLGMWINNLIRYNNFERLCNVANSREIIGNVWEEGDLIDGKNTSEN